MSVVRHQVILLVIARNQRMINFYFMKNYGHDLPGRLEEEEI